MKTKRVAAFLVLALLAASLASPALAAVLSAAASPNSLEFEGFVTLSLTVRNDGETAMSGISVTGPGVSYEALGQTVEPGKTATIAIPDVFIAADQIGKPLTYTVKWQQGGAQSKKVSLTVYSATDMGLVASRSASKTSALPGEVIYLTYSIHNTGAVELRNVSITDRNIAGRSALVSKLNIGPGETYQTVYEFTMGTATVISKPVISYALRSDPDNQRTYNIDNLSLGVINANLEVEVTQGATTAGGTEFTLNLVNEGNQSVKRIAVTAENGDKLHDGTFSLAIGEERRLTYWVGPEEARSVRFTVAGTDGTGADYSQNTGAYPVRVYIDPALLGLSLSARVLTPPTAADAAMLELVLHNTGSLMMSDALLTEAELGTLLEVGEVAPGDTRLELPLPLAQHRKLHITLTAADPAGNPHQYEVFLYSGQPAAAVDIIHGTHSGGGGVLATQVVLVLAILLAVLTAAAGALFFTARRREQQRRRALRRRRASS